MIVGNIKNAVRYYGVNSNFEKAFKLLKSLNVATKNGIIENDGFKTIVSTVETSDISPDGESKKLEAHREYLDIHYCIDGFEAIGYADISTLEPVTEYDAEQDFQLLNGDMNKVVLGHGDFCIVFPEDAHAPAMCVGGIKTLKKAVVKIKDNGLQ